MSPLPIVKPRTRSTKDVEALVRAKDRIRSTAIGSTNAIVETACRWLDLRRSPDSAVSAGSAIVTWLTYCATGHIDPLTATRHDARAYLVEVEALGYAPNTIGFRASTLRSVYEQAIEDEVLAANPFHGIKTPAREAIIPTPALTRQQCDRLVTSLSRPVIEGSATIHDHRNAAMAYVMIRVGPRRKEVSAARWGHIFSSDAGWNWRIHGKGNRWADTALPADAVDVLLDWRSVLEEALGREVRGADALFPALPPGRTSGIGIIDVTRDLPGLSRIQVSKLFRRMLADVGIRGPRLNAHSARATAATHAYDATKDLLAVQRMLRHRDQKTTAGYIRATATDSPAARWRPSAPAPIRPDRARHLGEDLGAA